jgi:hypothetical protein
MRGRCVFAFAGGSRGGTRRGLSLFSPRGPSRRRRLVQSDDLAVGAVGCRRAVP